MRGEGIENDRRYFFFQSAWENDIIRESLLAVVFPLDILPGLET